VEAKMQLFISLSSREGFWLSGFLQTMAPPKLFATAVAIPSNQDCAFCFSITELAAKVRLENEHGHTF